MSGYGELALVKSLAFLSESQAAIAHNLANVDSTGFKRRTSLAVPQVSDFQAMIDAKLPTIGYAERTDWSPGSMRATGEQMHIALEGERNRDLFFCVRAPNGALAYTRNGNLQIDEQGRLSTGDGSRYLDISGNEIALGGADGVVPSTVQIDANGTVRDVKNGQRACGTIGVYRVPEPNALVSTGRGMFQDPKHQPIVATPSNAIKQGYLEQSNVQSLEEMAHMLIVERTFQATAKALGALTRIQEAYTAALNR